MNSFKLICFVNQSFRMFFWKQVACVYLQFGAARSHSSVYALFSGVEYARSCWSTGTAEETAGTPVCYIQLTLALYLLG